MKAVVLGAGPAGLSAARMLAVRGAEVAVVERATFVGGASASRPVGESGARMDFGPHVFHLKNTEVNRFFFDHASGDHSVKRRNERILVRGRLFKYPLEITEVLRHLTPGHLLWMGAAFAVARLRLHTFPMADANFEAWGVSRFGRPLYEFSCGRYTEKVWGVRPSTLSAKLARQKLKDLRLRDIVSKLFGGRGEEHAKYWENYAYPEKGIGVVFENMAAGIAAGGGRILLSAPLLAVEADERTVRAVSVRHDDGRVERLDCDLLVNTVPLTHLAWALEEGAAGIRIPAAKELRYRGLVLVNVEFDSDRVTPYDWVYLLDELYRCNRFTEQKNMGGAMIPPGRSMVCFELAGTPGDAIWSMPDESIRRLVMEDIDRIEIFRGKKILDCHVSRLEDAYPMYTLDFDSRLEEVIGILGRSTNLVTLGRQGLFLNSDIHDSMEMGMKAATHLMAAAPIEDWYRYAGDYIRGRIGV